jgi:hypothetical protein
MTRQHPGLEPGERLRASAAASFRGATATSGRSTLSLASGRARWRSFQAWEEAAAAAGFPTAGPDMVLGVTDHRLVAWRTSFGLGRPVEIVASLPVERIVDAVAVRHGLVTGVAFVLDSGAIVEVEALRGRLLRVLADQVRAAVAERRGRA